jgi:outer membrane immunogenic protein
LSDVATGIQPFLGVCDGIRGEEDVYLRILQFIVEADMRKILLTLGVSLLAAGSAFAADMAARPYNKAPAIVPIYNWTGFYIGAHAGYGFEGGDADYTYGPSPAAFGLDAGRLSPKAEGFIGGGQIGYNWQTGMWVLGIEADISYFDFTGSASTIASTGGVLNPPFTQSASTKMDWFGTVRGRLGWTATPSLLLYATGGLAYGHYDYTINTAFTAPPFPGAGSETKAGWTVGAGAEWAFSPSWSVKGEYLYFDLGDTTVTSLGSPVAPPFSASTTFQNTGHIVRAGLNYKFGGPVVAKY